MYKHVRTHFNPELMKLRIMTISIKTMVLIKFGTSGDDVCIKTKVRYRRMTSEMMCIELRAKKL